jgi:hypothetical protein
MPGAAAWLEQLVAVDIIIPAPTQADPALGLAVPLLVNHGLHA